MIEIEEKAAFCDCREKRSLYILSHNRDAYENIIYEKLDRWNQRE